jgi:hypothetical protein
LPFGVINEKPSDAIKDPDRNTLLVDITSCAPIIAIAIEAPAGARRVSADEVQQSFRALPRFHNQSFCETVRFIANQTCRLPSFSIGLGLLQLHSKLFGKTIVRSTSRCGFAATSESVLDARMALPICRRDLSIKFPSNEIPCSVKSIPWSSMRSLTRDQYAFRAIGRADHRAAASSQSRIKTPAHPGYTSTPQPGG